MKKILILSISTGGGHHEVARNLRIGFEKMGDQVKVSNALEVVNPDVDAVVSKSYSILADKMPRLYGKIYYTSSKKPAKQMIAQTLSTISTHKNYKSLKEYNPDLVITTHPFPIPIIARLKKRGKITIPLISIITDFFPNSLYIDENVDAYVVGSFYTKQSLINFGVPKDKIFPYGIPIKEDFFAQSTKQPHETINLLLAGGSMGMSGIETILEKLMELDERFRIEVLCGNNNKLRDKLLQRYSYAIVDGRLTIHGFTNDVSRIMDHTDLMITKPGGLTTSECMKKGLPMVIPYYIPGQEEENLEFLLKENVALYQPDPERIATDIEKLCENPEDLRRMSAKMLQMSEGYSLQKVLHLADAFMTAYENSTSK